MFPVHVVTSQNRHLHEEELEHDHWLRHRIFANELGWTALRRQPDGRSVVGDAPRLLTSSASSGGRVPSCSG